MIKKLIKKVLGKNLADDFHDIKMQMKLRRYWKNEIISNKILFENFYGKGYGGNPKYIAEQFLKYKDKFDLVWAIEKGKQYIIPKGIRIVYIESEEYFYELATAKVWIDNVRKKPYVRKRKDQIYVQLWHGNLPLKRIEFDTMKSLNHEYKKSATNDSKMIDVFVSGNSWISQHLHSTFHYYGDVLEVGCVGNDKFFEDEGVIREKVFKFLGIMEKDTKIILYAPTFRKEFSSKYYEIDGESIVTILEERYKKKFIFLKRLHPNVRNLVGCQKNIYDVTQYDDIQELMKVADILITDYSSLMFDFAFMKKPVILYQPDYEIYLKDRQLNFYKLPFPCAKKLSEIMEIIKVYDLNKDDIVKNFMKNIEWFDNGNASQQVYEWIRRRI